MELPVVNHKDYVAKIDDDHKFPIKKFGELAKYLIEKEVVSKFYEPNPCSIETLKEAHSEKYILDVKNKKLSEKDIKKIGFPLNDSVVRRSFVATGGTVLASKLAINYGIACNTAGGSHHANFDGGAGYCVFNDVAVAAKYLLNRGLANRILIVDLDVHQGNGNSDIFIDNRNVFTFSMHSKSNYPAKKSLSDLDVELKDNTEDKEYLDILKFNLANLNDENFDFVFYIAGVDIHYNDRLGKLKITDQGINLRDSIVIDNFFSKRIPICGVLGGGYNKDFNKLIELHSSLHKTCAKYI
ncbi:histone deacetylase family protein [Candidatus Pelagibacter sp. RS40]|uniref:histone deacetylase family protein n=1 Tax=Candidatus Pelagibacter sp. RS40 TaxID=1977865 RepID=UPI000A163F9B|nr:histone deacetylase [Candidatus Pelagibacter sp. RS40]ARJ49357.1 histone deacetylase [Candidatus Pelagibacter sp. RS40]